MNRPVIKIFPLFSIAIAVTLSACAQTVSAPSQDDTESSHQQETSSYSATKSSSSGKATCSSSKQKNSSSAKSSLADIYEAVEKTGAYTSRDSVAAYLCKFDQLPGNYVGKNEGKKLYEAKGYTFSKWNFNPWTTIGVMIGGDNFDNFASDPDNYHKNLPEGKYHEADVEYSAKNRGKKRLVYQPGCIIYYTADHYETYAQIRF